MNKELEIFARAALLESLDKCTEAQQLIFKKMYSHKDLDKELAQVVADMDGDKLDWAMTQVQRTVGKNAEV